MFRQFFPIVSDVLERIWWRDKFLQQYPLYLEGRYIYVWETQTFCNLLLAIEKGLLLIDVLKLSESITLLSWEICNFFSEKPFCRALLNGYFIYLVSIVALSFPLGRVGFKDLKFDRVVGPCFLVKVTEFCRARDVFKTFFNIHMTYVFKND